MITGRQLVNEYYEDEKLYSTGDEDLDDLLERAFCEGYIYAQKEFVGKSNPSINFMRQKNGVSKLTGSQVKAAMKTRKAPRVADIDRTINANAKIVESRKKGWDLYDTEKDPFFGTKANALFNRAKEGRDIKISTLDEMSFGKGVIGRVRKRVNRAIPFLYKKGDDRWGAAKEVAGARIFE